MRPPTAGAGVGLAGALAHAALPQLTKALAGDRDGARLRGDASCHFQLALCYIALQRIVISVRLLPLYE